MRALDRKLLRDLWRLKGQAAAIAVLVGCAVCVYVASTATYHGLLETQRLYYQQARFGEIFAELRRAPQALAADLRALPGVGQVQTNVVADVPLQVPGLADPATARLVGVDRDGGELNRLHLRAGRALDPDAGDEALATEGFAKANGLAPGDSVTVVINGRKQRLRLVGVALSPEHIYAIRPGDLMPDDRRFGVLWMDREALASGMDLAGAFNAVSLTLSPGASRQSVMAGVDRLLKPYGGLQSYDRERHTSHRFVSDEIRQLKVMALAIPAIFLGVATFLLSVVFSRLVATQRQQIGTLKALGYADRSIVAHFLELAGAVTAFGGLLGTAAGFWLGGQWAQLYAMYYRFPVLHYRAEWGVAAQAALLVLAATAVGAGSAAMRVLRLAPAAAMLPEPPPTFRAGLLERIGVGRLLTTVGRMALRNLTRRPLRAALSSLGIASAVAVIVVGFYFRDALFHLIDLSFDVAQRQDVTVTYTTALAPAALDELRALPGVRRAEPFRAVPATLRHGHRSWRIAVMGLSEGARLQRIVDAAGRAVAPPASGLLVSERLAELLGARVGDEVELEVLEGRRPTLPVRIAGTVDDLLGVSATMSLPALWELMGEGRLHSGAFLSVDRAREQALFTRLRGMPRVAGVTLRSAAVSAFKEVSAELILVFAGFLIAFAGAIAVGIVYNSARIVLAERERELATLRVLGFTRGEAWNVLAAEIAVHLAVGIPLGFLGGWGLAAVSAEVFDTDLYRLPLVVTPSTWSVGALVVAAAAAVLLAIRGRLGRLDLVAVLKARE